MPDPACSNRLNSHLGERRLARIRRALFLTTRRIKMNQPVPWLTAVVVATFVVSSTAQMKWSTLLPAARPSPRADYAMVYDSARKRVVLFGGHGLGAGGIAQNAETWEWDGKTWKKLSVSGPGARSQFAMAYDSHRKRTVLFGGWDAARSGGGKTTFWGDTWEWDGTRWTAVSTKGPSPRSNHAMAFDPTRRKTVLFGGLELLASPPPSSRVLSDLWEWDGKTWTSVKTSGGPAARVSAGVAFVPTLGVLIHGGDNNKGTNFGDLRSWDGVRWRSLGSGPALGKHGMCWDPIRHRLVVRGGWGPTPKSDTWEWNTRSWFKRLNSGTPYSGHELVFDGTRSQVFQFGGLAIGSGFRNSSMVYQPTVVGTAQLAGPSCSRSGTIQLNAPRPPHVGDGNFTLTVPSAPAASKLFLLWSTKAGVNQTFGTCKIVPELSGVELTVHATNATGSAKMPFVVRFDPALSGLTIFTQAVIMHSGGPLFGNGSVSTALRLRIGD